MPAVQPKQLEYRDYKWKEIETAIAEFPVKICDGGFGPIYKGRLPYGTLIAVKQLSTDSKKGKQEFENEIDKLHKLEDHPNIVKLLGSCKEKKTKFLLVYKYMDNGNLRGALFGQQQKFIEIRKWPARFKICLGIAKGLAHLHDIAKIVHGDIKLSNVLIDDQWNPKISDFGLAKRKEETHFSSGTVEHMEYSRRGMITEKEDIYNFGLVTLELMSGRLNTSRPQSDQNVFLPDLANLFKKKGDLLGLIDKDLEMTIPVEKATMVLELALLCTNSSRELRPSMSKVVKHLEGEPLTKASQFQPNSVRNGDPERATTYISGHYVGNTSGETSKGGEDDNVGIQENFVDIPKPAKLEIGLHSLTVSNVATKSEVEYFEPVFVNGNHCIKCSNEELEARCKIFQDCLVGHFMDQRESWSADFLKKKIENLWKVEENVSVVELGNGYYLFRFIRADEKFRILESPDLWEVGRRQLVLMEWKASLKFDEPPVMKKLPVWVKIYKLPMIHWSTVTLCKIGSGFGVPIYIDRKTLAMDRGEYARVLIEVDAGTLLPTYRDITVNGEKHELALEYHPRAKQCANCCTFGHIEYECCLNNN